MHWAFFFDWRHFPLEVILSSEIERKKILIVDDELDMRIFLCNLLGNCGYEPIDADNRVEGLQKSKTRKTSLDYPRCDDAQRRGNPDVPGP